MICLKLDSVFSDLLGKSNVLILNVHATREYRWKYLKLKCQTMKIPSCNLCFKSLLNDNQRFLIDGKPIYREENQPHMLPMWNAVCFIYSNTYQHVLECRVAKNTSTGYGGKHTFDIQSFRWAIHHNGLFHLIFVPRGLRTSEFFRGPWLKNRNRFSTYENKCLYDRLVHHTMYLGETY